MGRDRAYDLALTRAIHGYTVPRFYRGKQVGTVHRYDNRMILSALNPAATPPQMSPERMFARALDAIDKGE